jgi:hypothetical protein
MTSKKKSKQPRARKNYPYASRRRIAAWRGFVVSVGRGLAGLILALALLALSGYLAARFFVTPEFLRSRMISALESTFHRPVKIAHVTLVLHQGLKVEGLEVLESEAFPGETFLSSEFLLVKFEPAALLRGRLVLSKILLMRPEIELVRRPDGIWNIQEVLTRPRAAGSGGRFALPPLSAAKTIAIENGSLRVRDMPRKLNLSFSEFQFEAEDFNLEETFAVRMSFVNSSKIGPKKVRANFSLDGGISLAGFRPEAASVTARSLSTTVDGKTIRASGELRNLRAPELDLKLELPALSAEDLGRYKPTPSWVDFPASRWEARLRPILTSTDTAALGDEVEVSTVSPSIVAYHVPHLSMQAGGVRLGAWGRYRLSDRQVFATLRLAGTDLSKLPGLIALWKANEPAGRATGTLSLEGPWNAPKLKRAALQLRGLGLKFWNGKRVTQADVDFRSRDGFRDWELRALRGNWIAYGNALSNIDLAFDVKNGDMVVPKLNLVWNESGISLKGCIKDVRRPTAVYLDGEVDKVRIDEAYAAIENLIVLRRQEKGLPPATDRRWATVLKGAIPPHFPDMFGRLSWSQGHSPNFTTDNFKLIWNLHDIEKGFEKLNGRFRISFGPGRMKNIPEMRKGHPLVDLLLIPYVEMHRLAAIGRFSLDTALPKSMSFTKAYGEFDAQRGIVGVNFVHFDSAQFVSYSDGKVDFPREKTDLHVLLRLPSESKNLAAKLTDDKGRPSIDVDLVDDLNSPSVNFNLRSIKSDDIENALAAGIQRVAPFPNLEDYLTCGRTP